MRRIGFLTLVLIIGCSEGSADRTESPARLPSLLHRLLLNENNDEMPPVTYGHLFHLDAKAMGKSMACVDCHHHLDDDPMGIPVACGTCHPHEAGDPRATAESDISRDGKPPDI